MSCVSICESFFICDENANASKFMFNVKCFFRLYRFLLSGVKVFVTICARRDCYFRTPHTCCADAGGSCWLNFGARAAAGRPAAPRHVRAQSHAGCWLVPSGQAAGIMMLVAVCKARPRLRSHGVRATVGQCMCSCTCTVQGLMQPEAASARHDAGGVATAQ